MANEIKALTIGGTRRTIKDETARTAAAAAQTTANAKQDALTFDAEPTSGSNNPVTSGGIYTAMQSFSPELPVASTTVLGGVMVDGTTITADENGVISGASTYTLPTASTSTLGGVKVDGSTINIDENGVISGASDAPTPDWEVYDPNADGYIANRPFYHDYDVQTILASQSFGGNYADYDGYIGTPQQSQYALVAENVSLSADITAGTSYKVTVGSSDYTVTAGSSTSYTLSGDLSSTKTITGIPLIVAGGCVIVRTSSKKASILLPGSAGQYPVPAKTVGVTHVTVDSLVQIDGEFIPIDNTYIVLDSNGKLTVDIQAIAAAINS